MLAWVLYVNGNQTLTGDPDIVMCTVLCPRSSVILFTRAFRSYLYVPGLFCMYHNPQVMQAVGGTGDNSDSTTEEDQGKQCTFMELALCLAPGLPTKAVQVLHKIAASASQVGCHENQTRQAFIYTQKTQVNTPGFVMTNAALLINLNLACMRNGYILFTDQMWWTSTMHDMYWSTDDFFLFQGKDQAVQKRAYRLLAYILEQREVYAKANFQDLLDTLLEGVKSSMSAAKRYRLRCLKVIAFPRWAFTKC